MKTLFRVTMFLIALVLQGCGTLFATVPNAQNEPVMLLGFDPTAYFTQAKRVELTSALGESPTIVSAI